MSESAPRNRQMPEPLDRAAARRRRTDAAPAASVELPWFRRTSEQLEQAAAHPHAGQLPKEHDGENAAIETEVA